MAIVYRAHPPSPSLEQVLFSLYMGKVQHNREMDLVDKRLEAKKLQIQEGREFQLKKEGYSQTTPSRKEIQSGQLRSDTIETGDKYFKRPQDNLVDLGNGVMGIYRNGKIVNLHNAPTEKSAYKEGQIVSRKEGDKFVEYQYSGGKLIETGKTAPRYKPTTNITNVLDIGEKQKQQDKAFLNSPKFIKDVTKDVSQLNKFDWDLWDSNQRESAIKEEADKRVKIVYPNATYGVQDGKIGWYTEGENGRYELVVPWSK